MRALVYRSSDDFLSMLRTLDANSAYGTVNTLTPALISLQYSTVRVDIEGSGMDVNQLALQWRSGTLQSVRYFSGNVEFAAFTQLGYRVLAPIDLATGLSAAISQNGNDEFIGSPFNDILFSGAGADVVTAGGGDDKVSGGLGNDRIDGGLGLDTAEFLAGRANFLVTPNSTGTGGTVTDRRTGSPEGTDTVSSIEYLLFTDSRVSLPELALGSPVAPDVIGTQVYRFAKLDNGQYFYSGNAAERDQIIATFANFRYEGPVYNAQDNWVSGYLPVYRFANLSNGGYFYTASAAERDAVFSGYPNFRYEGASFFVPASASSSTIPVFRLANLDTGGYLFTASAAERSFALKLGFWRDEGVAFNAPRTIALAVEGEPLELTFAGGSAPPPFDDKPPALMAAPSLDWLL